MVNLVLKRWSFRQYLLLILLIVSSTIAIIDEQKRDRFFELCVFALGGYLGQQMPQGIVNGKEDNH